MGNSQSSYQRSLIDVLNENITNIVIKTGSSATSYCKADQKIKIGTIVSDCGINIAQTSQTVCDLKQVFSAENTAKMTSLINNALDTSLASKQKSVQDFLSTSLSFQQSESDMSTHLKNIVAANFTNETLSQCIAESTVDQDMYIDKLVSTCKESKDGVNIGQNILLKQFADCTTKSVVDVLKDDKLVSNIVNKAESDQSSEQKGLSELLKAMIMPLIIIVVGLVVFAIVFKMLKGTVSDLKEMKGDLKNLPQN